MISFGNQRVSIWDLSDLTFEIILDSWWASINVGSKHPVAWTHSGQAPSWGFYLHCGMEENRSPGIICIICHEGLSHPSEHGTSSMGKHLLARSHIAKLYEFPELEVTKLTSSLVDETALAILKRQGSQGITLLSLQSKIIFHIQVLSMSTELTDETTQSGSEGLWDNWISPKHLQSIPHVRICFSSHSIEHYIELWAMMVI